MKRRDWAWPLTILASAAAAGAAMAFAAPGNPVRLVAGFWFLLVCPGMALVRLFGFEEPVAEWTLAVALSLALDTIVAGAMLYAGLWSPSITLLTLIGICVAGAVLQIAGAIRSERAGRSTAAASASASFPARRRWSLPRRGAGAARQAVAAQTNSPRGDEGDRAAARAPSAAAAPAEGVASGVPFA